MSEKKDRLDALFARGSRDAKLTDEQVAELERKRDRADRLLSNTDFVEFLRELELEYGGLIYSTEEVDTFTQGRLSFFNDMKARLYISEKASGVFAEFVKSFISPMAEDFAKMILYKETNHE